MKKVISILLVLFLASCVTVKVPKYLDAEYEYKQDFNSDFEATFAATVDALKGMGWKISDTESQPFSRVSVDQEDARRYETLIITQLKQRSAVVYSTYLTLNAYVRSIDTNNSEVEIRYLSITVLPPPLGQWRVDRNDGLVNKIYRRIGKNLKAN